MQSTRVVSVSCLANLTCNECPLHRKYIEELIKVLEMGPQREDHQMSSNSEPQIKQGTVSNERCCYKTNGNII